MQFRRALVLVLALVPLLSACSGKAAPTPTLSLTPVELTSSFVGTDTGFGTAVDVDGDVIAVGSPGGAEMAGAIELFGLDGDAWSPHATLVVPGSLAVGVSLSLDEDALVAGSSKDNGEVLFFARTGNDWSHMQTLTPPEGADVGGDFGREVLLDGDTLLVSAPWEDGKASGSGAVYVYEKGKEGWEHLQTLRPSNEVERGRFGSALALESSTLAVGASDAGNGEVYLFGKENGQWREEERLESEWKYARFGSSLAFDKNTLAVGASGDIGDNSFSGGVVLFEKREGWKRADVVANPDPGEHFSLFGSDVEIEGDLLLIAAQGSSGTTTPSGSVRVFSREGDEWLPVSKQGLGLEADHFGASMAFDAQTLVIGSPGELGASVNPPRAFSVSIPESSE